MHTSRFVFAVLALLVLAHAAIAQAPSQPTEKIEAIKQLDHWVGQWEGRGWIEYGGRRFDFDSKESIAKKIGGVALLVEGKHTAKGPGGREMTVHDAMGVMTYDDTKQEYRFITFLATGRNGNYKAELLQPGRLRWTIDDIPVGDMRYTIDFTQDTWQEVGEMAQPDGTWKKMFEMKLKKVNTP